MLPQDHPKALAAEVRACFLSVTSLSLSYRTAACPVRQSHSLLPFRIRLPLMYIRLLYIYPLYNYLRHIYPPHHIPKHFPLMYLHRKGTPPVCFLPLNIPLMSFYPRRKPAPLRALPPGLYPVWSVLAAQASGLRQAPVQPVLSLHVPSQSPFSIQAYS